MKTAIVIPARYASTRLPGKPLRLIAGQTLVQHTYEQAMKVKGVDRIIIATDDDRIESAVRQFGGEVRMTRSSHRTGTERVAEIASGIDADLLINLQGDEPEIDPGHIERLIALHESAAPYASTLACPFPAEAKQGSGSPEDTAAVKVELGEWIDEGRSAYAANFTRDLPPCERDAHGRIVDPQSYNLHIGIYGFFRDALLRFANTPETSRERIERLEQLRILGMGEKIAVAIVDRAAPGVDTEADLLAAARRLEKQ